MYVTRRLSQLQKSPDLLSARPDGPNSGYLVIQDEETANYSCFGLCKNHALKRLPFPQNKELYIVFGDKVKSVFMIPVLNQPLSSNLYYTIEPHRKHIGEAFSCSTEDEKGISCCLCNSVKDVTPRPLDPHSIYQQFEIVLGNPSRHGYFSAKSIAPDGVPPYFFRPKTWPIHTKTPDGLFKLHEAGGVDSSLRARLPELVIFSPSSVNSSQPVHVGKWYCPFMFVKEGTLREQMKRSMYYEVTLEQRWEQIFSYQKNNVYDSSRENSVVVDALVEKEEVFVYGNEATWSVQNGVDGVIWFMGYGSGGEQRRVGLRQEVVQRMKWEQERFGWVGGEEKQVKISRVEEFKESRGWTVLRCYVLVERFNLKRMNGSLVMAYDFKHCHQIKIKWE